MTQAASAHSGNLLLLVGTKKGSFLLTGDSARRNWTLSGPYNQGAEVFHLAYDSRNGGRILAAANYMIWGPQLEFSDDLGGSWTPATQQPRFTEGDGPTVNCIWHIEPAPANQPGAVCAGVEPAALFRSNDYGVSWNEVTGLSKHPTRPEWQPGFGGLCLHSIVTDPSTTERVWVGGSASGVWGTDDGDANWKPSNRGVRADFDPARPSAGMGPVSPQSPVAPAGPHLPAEPLRRFPDRLRRGPVGRYYRGPALQVRFCPGPAFPGPRHHLRGA